MLQQFDTVIAAVEAGQPVDLSAMPPPPSAIVSTSTGTLPPPTPTVTVSESQQSGTPESGADGAPTEQEPEGEFSTEYGIREHSLV